MIDFCNGHADDAGVRCAESNDFKYSLCVSLLLMIQFDTNRLHPW